MGRRKNKDKNVPIKEKKVKKINLAIKVQTLKDLIDYSSDMSDGALVSKLRQAHYDGYLQTIIAPPYGVYSIKEYFTAIRSGIEDFDKSLKLPGKAVSAYKSKLSYIKRKRAFLDIKEPLISE